MAATRPRKSIVAYNEKVSFMMSEFLKSFRVDCKEKSGSKGVVFYGFVEVSAFMFSIHSSSINI